MNTELSNLIPKDFVVTENLQEPMCSTYKVTYSPETFSDIKSSLGKESALAYMCRELSNDFHNIEIHGYGTPEMYVCEHTSEPIRKQNIYFDGYYKHPIVKTPISNNI